MSEYAQPQNAFTSGSQINVLDFLRKLFKNPCSQAELNKIVPFGFSLQRQKMVFFAIKIV